MKKKKAAWYLFVIASLLVLSIVTPLMIRSLSRLIVSRIGRKETDLQTETNFQTEQDLDISEAGGTEDITEASKPETESYKTTLKPGSGHTGLNEDQTEAADPGLYHAPSYASQAEEDEANRLAYEDMTAVLKTEEEAAAQYRAAFSPVYDELEEGLMSRFLSGQEQFFYEDLANYCFGHYNTTFEIYKVRFDAMLEDTAEKMTVILEFFTKEDLSDEMHTPDLAVCSYMKANRAFVFFQSNGR